MNASSKASMMRNGRNCENSYERALTCRSEHSGNGVNSFPLWFGSDAAERRGECCRICTGNGIVNSNASIAGAKRRSLKSSSPFVPTIPISKV